jgi:S1-C subfamily serine protease
LTIHLLSPIDLGEERWRAQRKGSMRLGTKVLSLGCAGLAVALMPTPGQAQSDPAALTAFAVHINRTPKQSWPGYGIYLGNGLILTAAHVAGDVAQTKPHVVIAGQDLPATLVKQGSLEGVDLTLLSIDGTKLPVGLQMRRTPLCDHPPIAGQAVVVAIPEGTAPSKVLPRQAIPADLRGRFDTAIADVATTGNSGSGVFDAGRLCLMGIMSRKISVSSTSFKVGAPARTIDIAKYFVPAAQIKAFIPDNVSF